MVSEQLSWPALSITSNRIKQNQPMDSATLRALDFDRVVEAVRSFAITPLGSTALNDLKPQTELRLVKELLATTSEGVDYLKGNSSFPLESPDDINKIVNTLAVQDRVLEPSQLKGLSRLLSSFNAVRTQLKNVSGGPYPSLQAVIRSARSFEAEIHEVNKAINEQGCVVDMATPQLKNIRARLQRQRQQLRSTLESYLRGRDTSRYLQEKVISERNGRFVLVVRSEHRTAIPGIVHGSSGSGASLFLEPLSTVEINNEIVSLEDAEMKELHRILLELSNSFRKRALDFRHTLTAITSLDVIQAKANFSKLVEGVEPTLAPEGNLNIPKARHPLLINSVRARTGDTLYARDNGTSPGPVPVDICLKSPNNVLVITGPNTGGKTVALKTAGLLVVMAQTGLHIPAGLDAVIPVCRSIFTDIGDDQSIATSLSTFSGHIANIVSMDKQMLLPSLVLLDEVGAGTNPIEGGALGAAVIDHFRHRGALVVATTHDDLLKSYSATTAGVTCAGFGFDVDTYAPSYELTYGSPGRSLAFEIAARLGMHKSILDDAQTRRTDREAQLAKHLEKLEKESRTLKIEREVLERTRFQLEKAKKHLELRQHKLAEQDLSARTKLTDSIDGSIRAARSQVDHIVETLRRQCEQYALVSEQDKNSRPYVSTGDLGSLKHRTLNALESVRSDTTLKKEQRSADLIASVSSPMETNAEPPAVGDRVHIQHLRGSGTVINIKASEADVEYEGKRIRMPLKNLVAVHESEQTAERGSVTLNVALHDIPSPELNLVGYRINDAIPLVEKHLDQAMLHEQCTLRVIHGHGTGQLRDAISLLLEEHPLVDTFGPAPSESGGGGVTIIKLRN